MGEPTTAAFLQREVDRLNKLYEFEGGDKLVIEYTMGRPRLYRSFGAVEVSPRLTKPQMALFLDGLYAAMGLVVHTAILQVYRALIGACECGHPMPAHQSGEGPWTGFCADQECKCEWPTKPPARESRVERSRSRRWQ